jgi:nucleoid-associated protein YgaU
VSFLELDLKATLKTLKINEPTISAILGAIVLITIAILVVNYFKKSVSTISTSVPAVQTENSQASLTLPTKHTVQKGEHLWKISEQYYKSGYNWVDIVKANNITNPSLLTEGQELSIPQVEAKQATVLEGQQMAQAPPVGQITKTAVNIEAITESTYTAVQGDSLWKIAVRAYSDGYQWPKLVEENKFVNPDRVLVGQTISIPR